MLDIIFHKIYTHWYFALFCCGDITMDKSCKSHNALFPYPTMYNSEQKCAHFCSEWCIVGYGTGALWGLWMRSLLRGFMSCSSPSGLHHWHREVNTKDRGNINWYKAMAKLVNTLRPWQNGCYFTCFQLHFLEWKYLNFDWSFSEICSQGSNEQEALIGSDNGLALKRYQAIIWKQWEPSLLHLLASMG